MSELRLLEIPTNDVVDGEVQVVTKFIIAGPDSDTKSIDGKFYDDVDEARAAKADLANKEEGMEYAVKGCPGLSAKAQVGKANVISDYILWVKEGKPVRESKKKTTEQPPAAQAGQEGEDF